MSAISDERTDFSIMLSKHFHSLDASFSSTGCKTQSVRNFVSYSSDNVALKFHGRVFCLYVKVLLHMPAFPVRICLFQCPAFPSLFLIFFKTLT